MSLRPRFEWTQSASDRTARAWTGLGSAKGTPDRPGFGSMGTIFFRPIVWLSALFKSRLARVVDTSSSVSLSTIFSSGT